MKKISFSGHRKLPDEPLVKKRLMSVLEPLIISGAEDFYAGGALGFDTIAAECVIELREKYPHIRLGLILPCERNAQTLYWNDKQREEYDSIRKNADSVEIVGSANSKYCMRERNLRLANSADILVCWYNEENNQSGTGQTVRMAENRDIQVLNLFEMRDLIVNVK